MDFETEIDQPGGGSLGDVSVLPDADDTEKALHDLGNALTVVMGNAELLRSQSLPESAQHRLDRILSETDRAMTMTAALSRLLPCDRE